MRVVIAYESMFGNTRLVAEAIAAGIGSAPDVEVMPISRVTLATLDGVDLFVVGGPTHMHSFARPSSRQASVQMADKPASGVTLEPEATGPGVREWFDELHGTLPVRAAAFDTRMHGPAVFTGRASRPITRQLRQHGARVVSPPRSFLVGKDSRLDAGEQERAREWGRILAKDTAAAMRAPSRVG